MEKRSVVLIAIALLGFLSGLLALIAEGKKITDSEVTRLSETECVHSRSPALVLGLLAASALVIAQVTSNAYGGCICCETAGPLTKDRSTVLAVGFLVLSWVTFSIGFLLLVSAASVNDDRDTSDALSSGCFVLRSGVFTGAALLSFTTAILGITYNLQVTSIRTARADPLDSSSGSSELVERRSSARSTSPTRYAVGQPILSSSHDNARPKSVALMAPPYAVGDVAYGNRNMILNASPNSGRNLGAYAMTSSSSFRSSGGLPPQDFLHSQQRHGNPSISTAALSASAVVYAASDPAAMRDYDREQAVQRTVPRQGAGVGRL